MKCSTRRSQNFYYSRITRQRKSQLLLYVVVDVSMARRMEVSLVIRFNLRFTMKLTQTLSTVHTKVDLKHSLTCIQHTKYRTILNICIHTIHYELTHESLFFLLLLFGTVGNIPGFMAGTALYVRRRPLVNGNAFDHVALTMLGYFRFIKSYTTVAHISTMPEY